MSGTVAIHRLMLTAMALFWLLAPASAGQISSDLAIDSPILGRAIPYAIYLPEQRKASNAPLPVLFLLHGRDDTERAWLDNGRIAATLDAMIAAGKLQPLIAVMPMAANSWYVDDARSPQGHGAFARAFIEDFMPAIEKRYAGAGCRSGRAIAGLSMGGYGAMLYAISRPDLFEAAVSLSGSLFSDQPADMDARLPFYARILNGIHGEPFDVARFRSWTVFSRLEAAPPGIEKLGFWLAAGDGDFAGILSGTVRLHQDLRRRKLDSHLRIYDGDHTWALWSMAIEPALAWLSPRLDPGCGVGPAIKSP